MDLIARRFVPSPVAKKALDTTAKRAQGSGKETLIWREILEQQAERQIVIGRRVASRGAATKF